MKSRRSRHLLERRLSERICDGLVGEPVNGEEQKELAGSQMREAGDGSQEEPATSEGARVEMSRSRA